LKYENLRVPTVRAVTIIGNEKSESEDFLEDAEEEQKAEEKLDEFASGSDDFGKSMRQLLFVDLPRVAITSLAIPGSTCQTS
jgi:hypothetical protein